MDLSVCVQTNRYGWRAQGQNCRMTPLWTSIAVDRQCGIGRISLLRNRTAGHNVDTPVSSPYLVIMRHRGKRALFLLATVSSLIMGCGTAHRYLPGRPLNHGEWEFSVAWHLDVNPLSPQRGLVWPEFNAYVGVGKRYNLGFGPNVPCFVDHLTLAHYDGESADNYWLQYGQVKLLSPYHNPLIEFGGGYSAKQDWFRQTALAGIAYGSPLGWWNIPTRAPLRLHDRLLPFLKYTGASSDIGMSFIHYHGLTRSTLDRMRAAIIADTDTLLSFAPGELVAIQVEEAWSGTAMDFHRITFRLADSSQVVISPPHANIDQFFRAVDDLRWWLGPEYYPCYWNDELTILDARQLSGWQAGQPLVVTRYPASLLKRIDGIRSLTADNSFGWGLLFHRDR